MGSRKYDLATERSKRGKCCICTCIVSLTAQVRLICGWCMKICLRRAARISTERLISVQPDEQTEIDMGTNMAENIGDKSVYIRAFWPREINQSSQRSIQSNKYYPRFVD
jgi:hypothetical protein